MSAVSKWAVAGVMLGGSTVNALAISVPGNNLQGDFGANPLVTEVRLSVKTVADGCPATVRLYGQILTAKPGTVQYFLAQKGGAISGPFTLESKVTSAGKGRAEFSKEYKFLRSISTEYKILIVGNQQDDTGYWVPVTVTC